jgi:hypothetical protein
VVDEDPDKDLVPEGFAELEVNPVTVRLDL